MAKEIILIRDRTSVTLQFSNDIIEIKKITDVKNIQVKLDIEEGRCILKVHDEQIFSLLDNEVTAYGLGGVDTAEELHDHLMLALS